MEISKSEAEKRARKHFFKESQELDNKENEYRKKLIEGNLNLDLNWNTNIDSLPSEMLKLADTEGIDNVKENFVIKILDLDKILGIQFQSDEKANEIYPKDSLWDNSHRSNSKLTGLIEFIENGNLLCPPILHYKKSGLNISDVLGFSDGNHRIALARFLKIKEIPILISKVDFKRLEKEQIIND